MNAPWFLTGDFNDLLSNSEKEGEPPRAEGSFIDTRSFYSEGDLYVLRHSGDCLSWRGVRGADEETYVVRCRLDRATANSYWAELFPNARSQYLTYEGSDHKPILSYFEPDKRKRRGLFRYDRRLKNNPAVKELVKQIWDSDPTAPVNDRIKLVRSALIQWSKQQYQNSRELIEHKRAELEEALIDPAKNTELITKVSNELNDAYLSEEEYWRQKSMLLWLSLGDKNTGFFHATAKNWKQANGFTVIEDVEGNMVFQEDQIGKVIVSYFHDLFKAIEGNR